MIKDLKQSLEAFYQQWLLEEYAEDIHCEDDLLRLVENRRGFKDFKAVVMNDLKRLN